MCRFFLGERTQTGINNYIKNKFFSLWITTLLACIYFLTKVQVGNFPALTLGIADFLEYNVRKVSPVWHRLKKLDINIVLKSHINQRI